MTPHSDRALAALTPRIAPVCLALIAAYAIAIALILATSHAGLDAHGKPVGSDFSNVWTAGRLTIEGAPQAAYDLARHYAEQVREFGQGVPFYGWHYPPMFLGVAALLATLPYLPALAVWQAATLPLYLAAILTIAGPDHRRETLLIALAFPAVFVNLLHGHNGFLTAGLFGLGLALLNRRPILSGVLLGLLAYKPQFGALIPFALIASGHWRTVAAAALTVVAICGASLGAFGIETWEAFAASATFTRTVVLEQGDTGWHKIMTAFSAARAFGAGIGTAYAVQAAVAAATLALTIKLWRSDAPSGAKAAGLLAGSLLMTPYALDYDLMALAPAIAFLARDAIRYGFRSGEAVTLALVWIAPLVARPIAEATLAPVGLLSIMALFALAASRAVAPSPARTSIHAHGR